MLPTAVIGALRRSDMPTVLPVLQPWVQRFGYAERPTP